VLAAIACDIVAGQEKAASVVVDVKAGPLESVIPKLVEKASEQSPATVQIAAGTVLRLADGLRVPLAADAHAGDRKLVLRNSLGIAAGACLEIGDGADAWEEKVRAKRWETVSVGRVASNTIQGGVPGSKAVGIHLASPKNRVQRNTISDMPSEAIVDSGRDNVITDNQTKR
jgi:hypothetical protein